MNEDKYLVLAELAKAHLCKVMVCFSIEGSFSCSTSSYKSMKLIMTNLVVCQKHTASDIPLFTQMATTIVLTLLIPFNDFVQTNISKRALVRSDTDAIQ